MSELWTQPGVVTRPEHETTAAWCVDCQEPVEMWRGVPVVVGGRVLLRCRRCAGAPRDQAPTAVSALTRHWQVWSRVERTPWRDLVRRWRLWLAQTNLEGGLRAWGARAARSRRIRWAAVVAGATLLLGGLVVGAGLVGAGLAQSALVPAVVASDTLETPGLTQRMRQVLTLRPGDAWRGALLPAPAVADGEQGEAGGGNKAGVPATAATGLGVDADWIFPLPDVRQTFPLKPSAQFGAIRGRVRPPPRARSRGCRGGHCGVDLYAPRGTPVVAVSDGTVKRAVRTLGKSAGRYIELSHRHGLTTAYMHLDSVREDLEEGMAVKQGEMIGTLGRTGIKRSPAHLHFVVRRGGFWNHVDPEPLLANAEVIDLLDMSVGIPDSFILGSGNATAMSQ